MVQQSVDDHLQVPASPQHIRMEGHLRCQEESLDPPKVGDGQGLHLELLASGEPFEILIDLSP